MACARGGWSQRNQTLNRHMDYVFLVIVNYWMKDHAILKQNWFLGKFIAIERVFRLRTTNFVFQFENRMIQRKKLTTTEKIESTLTEIQNLVKCIRKTRQCTDYSAKPNPHIEIEAFHAENLQSTASFIKTLFHFCAQWRLLFGYLNQKNFFQFEASRLPASLHLWITDHNETQTASITTKASETSRPVITEHAPCPCVRTPQ